MPESLAKFYGRNAMAKQDKDDEDGSAAGRKVKPPLTAGLTTEKLHTGGFLTHENRKKRRVFTTFARKNVHNSRLLQQNPQ